MLNGMFVKLDQMKIFYYKSSTTNWFHPMNQNNEDHSFLIYIIYISLLYDKTVQQELAWQKQ